MAWEHPTGDVPESVAIVGLGPSKRDFVADQGRHEPGNRVDEVWAVNTAIRWCKHDVAFIMDDMNEFSRFYPDYGETMRNNEAPIITSRKYEQFEPALEFPLAEVVGATQQLYFNNSVPYMIAYALFIGVKRIVLFGVDYTHPGTTAREDGRGCTEFWLGYAIAKGMSVEICTSSTLMDVSSGQRFYGYLSQPLIKTRGEDGHAPIPADNICHYKQPGSTSAA